MSDALSLVQDSAARLFAQNLDRATRDAAERGEWPSGIWQARVDVGFTDIVTSGDVADGSALPTLGRVLRTAAQHAVLLPLAEHALAQAMAKDADYARRPAR